MKKSALAVMLSILAFVFICGCKTSATTSVEHESVDPLKEAAAKAGYNSLKATIPGLVLLWGWIDDGYSVNYDPSTLTDQEREDLTQIGLQALSDKFANCKSLEEAIYCSTVLATFYHQKKDAKKCLYWTFKGAEKGSSSCMSLLSTAYCKGDGVVEDLTESFKWTYLAAAAGDECSKQWLKGDGYKLMSYAKTASMMKEAQKRAKVWAEAHRNAFASPT